MLYPRTVGALPRAQVLPPYRPALPHPLLLPAPTTFPPPRCSAAANQDTVSKFIKYSVALFVLSLGAFFLFGRTAAADLFTTTSRGRDLCGAIAAVVVANSVIAAYVVSAFNEPADPPEVRARTLEQVRALRLSLLQQAAAKAGEDTPEQQEQESSSPVAAPPASTASSVRHRRSRNAE